MMKIKRDDVVAYVTVFFIAAWSIGYIINLYKIVNASELDSWVAITFRAISAVLFPLGGIVGWM